MLVSFYIPFEFLKKFRNEKDKREFAVYGIAVGVSAAFSAPIGWTLFAYELSRPSTFLSFGMIWRTFFASAVCTYSRVNFIIFKINKNLKIRFLDVWLDKIISMTSRFTKYLYMNIFVVNTLLY